MTKRLLFLILLLAVFQKVTAQTAFAWANALGDSGDDAARTSCVDASGNTYVAGVFSGTTDFNTGSGTASFTSVGGLDAFIVRYDAAGNYVWAKTFGGTGAGAPATLDDYIHSITTDAAGNVYATGFFQNTVDFDPSNPGVNVLTSLGLGDLFIIKYDANGNFQWVKQMGGAAQQIGYAIKLDATGNIYVSGQFSGAGDFDPDPGNTVTLTPTGAAYDAFLAKYDNNGNYVWANKFGSTTSTTAADNFWSIDIDVVGIIYVAGYLGATADMDPGPGTANITVTGLDAFVAEYTTDGDYKRSFRIGGGGSDLGRCIKVDNQGSFYVTGYYNSASVDFDPSAGSFTLGSSNYDIFVAKYDTLNTYNWVRRIAGSGADHGWQLDVDNSQNVYVTGYYFSSPLSILGPSGTGVGSATLSNPGSTTTSDAFIVKYDNSGGYLSSERIGGTGTTNDAGYALSVNPLTNDLLLAGAFSATPDFDFSSGTANRTASAGTDIYIAKYMPVALSTIDFRTKQSGNWSDASSWESTYNSGTSWEDASVVPTFGVNNITVRTGQTITSDADITVDQAVVENGATLNIAPGASLNLNNGTGNDITVDAGGALVLQSDATGTGRIGSLGGGSISGSTTVQCFITGQRGYRALAHPFSNTLTVTTDLLDDIDATSPGASTPWISGGNSVFSFIPANSTGSSNTAYGALTPGSDNWVPGSALLTFIRGAKGEGLSGTYTTGPSDNTIDFTGNVNVGSASLTYDLVAPVGAAGWNMVGNPLPSQIMLNQVTGILNSDLNDFVSVYNPMKNAGTSQQNRGGYDVVQIKTGTTATGGYVLPMCAAFYVQNQSATNSNVQIAFDETCKTSSAASGVLFKTTNVNDMIELKVYMGDTTETDNLYLRFTPNATTNGLDKTDVTKFNNNLFNIYALSSDNLKMVVDSRDLNLMTSGSVIPLGISTSQTGDFNIKAAQISVPAGKDFYLHDKYNNTQTLITPSLNYAFSITTDTATKGNNRFEIVFSNNTTSVTGTVAEDFYLNIAPNPATNNMTLNYSTKNNNTTITITDVTGRNVFGKTLASQDGIENIDIRHLAPGVYLLKAQAGGQAKTIKFIKN